MRWFCWESPSRETGSLVSQQWPATGPRGWDVGGERSQIAGGDRVMVDAGGRSQEVTG